MRAAMMGTLVATAVACTLSACALEDNAAESGQIVRDTGSEQQALGDLGARPAEASPRGCSRGDFCAYSAEGEQGSLLLAVAGNWSGSISGVGSVFNNGVPFPGADHIQLDWNFGGVGWTQCVHYNPGPGQYKIDFVGVQIVRARWRGECGAGEDVSHRR